MEVIGDFKQTLLPIVDRDCTLCQSESEEKDHVYTISIPVSDARRDALRGVKGSTPALLEKAGLAGAKIFLLLLPLGVDFEELPNFKL